MTSTILYFHWLWYSGIPTDKIKAWGSENSFKDLLLPSPALLQNRFCVWFWALSNQPTWLFGLWGFEKSIVWLLGFVSSHTHCLWFWAFRIKSIDWLLGSFLFRNGKQVSQYIHKRKKLFQTCYQYLIINMESNGLNKETCFRNWIALAIKKWYY